MNNDTSVKSNNSLHFQTRLKRVSVDRGISNNPTEIYTVLNSYSDSSLINAGILCFIISPSLIMIFIFSLPFSLNQKRCWQQQYQYFCSLILEPMQVVSIQKYIVHGLHQCCILLIGTQRRSKRNLKPNPEGPFQECI